MEPQRKTPAVVMIVIGLGIFLLPFTPRWMVDWAMSDGGMIMISPLSLVITASLGSVLFLTGIWKLINAMRRGGS